MIRKRIFMILYNNSRFIKTILDQLHIIKVDPVSPCAVGALHVSCGAAALHVRSMLHVPKARFMRRSRASLEKLRAKGSELF